MLPEDNDPDHPPDTNDGDEPITQVVDSADMVEEPELVEEAPEPAPPISRAAAPPPSPHERVEEPAPPSDPPTLKSAVPPPGSTDPVEELSSDDLMSHEAAPPTDGVLETALAAARAVAAEGGGLRRIAFYETEIEALAKEPDKARLSLYQHEIGELLEDGGDEGAAVKAYAKALQSDATLKPNLWAIRRVFQQRALWPNLLKLLDAEIRFAKSEPERAELLVEKGQLLEDQLNDPQHAKECYAQAAEVHPASVTAWMSLEKIYTRDGDLAGLARVLRGQADAVAEPGRKVALLLDLARLQESLEGDGGSMDAALELCREAYQAGGEPELSSRALDEIERLAQPAGRTEDVLWALEARALILAAELPQLGAHDKPAAVDKLVAHRRRQAQLARELPARGGERAWEYLEEAIKHAPSDPLLARDLEQLAEQLQRWDELAILVGKRAEAASGPQRVSLQLERAEALRRAGKAAEAEACEAEVVRDTPQHLGLLVSRERDALRAGDWDRLASLYLSEAEAAQAGKTPTDAVDAVWAATAFTQAGMLLGDKSGRDAEALAALERARAAVPGFRLAVDALERLYARAGKHAEHAALLEDELKSDPDKARSRQLLETLIAVRDSGLDDPAGAAQAARRLCELRPDDVRVRLRLIELDRASARWADLAEDLAALAKRVPEDRRIEVLVERGDVLERRLADDEAAARTYKEALAIKPGEPRAAAAFEAISRRRSGRSGSGSNPQPTPEATPLPPQAWDDLAQALKREAEASLSPERISSVLLKLGEIHERERGNFDDAAAAYRDLLDKVPGQPAALRGLQRAYAALGDQAHRAEALELEVEGISEASSKSAALTLLGELYEDRLKQEPEADDAYVRALACAPQAHAAFGRLRTSVRRRDAQAALEALTVLEGHLGGGGGDGGARAALLDERAWSLRVAGDADQAGVVVREALGQSSGAGTTSRLQRVRLAARAGSTVELSDALDALAHGLAGGDATVQAVLERRAGLLELGRGRAGQPVAVQRLKQGQALAPSDAELLVALCDAPGALDPDALQLRIALADPTNQVEWAFERAERLEALGRLADAGREATRVLAEDPRHLPALELMRRLLRAGKDDAGHAHATARLAAEVQDAERSAALHAEAGATFEKVGLRNEAAVAYRAVLDRTPLDGGAFNRARALLHALHAESRQPGPLVELYTHRLTHVQDPGDRTGLLLDRAEVLSGGGDREGAERDLRAVLELNREHLGAMRRLAELLGASPRVASRRSRCSRATSRSRPAPSTATPRSCACRSSRICRAESPMMPRSTSKRPSSWRRPRWHRSPIATGWRRCSRANGTGRRRCRRSPRSPSSRPTGRRAPGSRSASRPSIRMASQIRARRWSRSCARSRARRSSSKRWRSWSASPRRGRWCSSSWTIGSTRRSTRRAGGW